MRLSTLLLWVMIGVAASGAPINIYSSGFEGTDGGWVESGYGDWERGTIVFTDAGCDTAGTTGPSGANSGSEAWGTVLNTCYANSNADSILSQTFDLTGYTTATFSWYQWHHVFETFDYAVMAANGDQLFRTPDFNPADWHQQVVDLTPYAGGLVTLTFTLHATTVVNRPGWYLDDMLLTADGAQIPEPSTWALLLAGLGAIAARRRIGTARR